jgi:CheY-like chemotaxis protein
MTPSRVLVVDDTADLRVPFCASLERAGYEVTGAESGADCLRIVAENLPGFAGCSSSRYERP